ncbi:acyl-CoA thioesterase [Stenoxybacter acetivorans]|uniref:acyl-CoA thioesterase n=1 Tax=Stenoxybacter acetivorans TaxID=422441 RepID=UPI00055B01D1|nr:thioesterase family protein [Stenoxybacter acetivorans]
MSRIRIDLPEHFLFSTSITVQIGDINYGNHLANDAVLRLCHEARMRWLQSMNFSELNAGGVGLIMADAAIKYQAQAFHGDILRLDLGIADKSSSGFALIYRISRTKDQTNIALAKIGMVFFDYAAQRVSKIPAAFLSAVDAAVKNKEI